MLCNAIRMWKSFKQLAVQKQLSYSKIISTLK